MVQRTPATPASFYEADETGWLEATADLIRQGRLTEVDSVSLAGYLTDMARRDRRELVSRLVVLLTHLLKWEYQPDRRSKSWRASIRTQRWELRDDLESGTLRNHAAAVFADAYARARDTAADETELDLSTFPKECPWSLDEAVDGPEPTL